MHHREKKPNPRRTPNRLGDVSGAFGSCWPGRDLRHATSCGVMLWKKNHRRSVIVSVLFVFCENKCNPFLMAKTRFCFLDHTLSHLHCRGTIYDWLRNCKRDNKSGYIAPTNLGSITRTPNRELECLWSQLGSVFQDHSIVISRKQQWQAGGWATRQGWGLAGTGERPIRRKTLYTNRYCWPREAVEYNCSLVSVGCGLMRGFHKKSLAVKFSRSRTYVNHSVYLLVHTTTGRVCVWTHILTYGFL